jgi:MFS family permease
MESSRIETISYKDTAIACYLGIIVQAIVINLTPILFIPLRELYGFSYSQLGLLVLINFVTQVLVDIGLSNVIDKHGFRIFTTIGQACVIGGLILFALTPLLFQNGDIYLGLVIATVIFSAGGGLMEMLLSPIVNSIPTDVKATAMSVLHSFYAWGQVAVILFTTLLIFLFGIQSWSIIVMLWLVIPCITLGLFIKVPLAPAIPETQRTKMKDYIKNPYFIVAIIAIAMGGSSEVSMAQWASAFAERGLSLPKVSGDVFGVAFFALMLGVGRFIYGKYGTKINVNKFMIYGSLTAIGCYFLIALSPIPSISLIACGICGFAVCLLWPGTLVITSEKFPLAGTSIFALMAAGGDIGASVGPWAISAVTDSIIQNPAFLSIAAHWGITIEQFGLRLGILFGIIFPIFCLICHIWLNKHNPIPIINHIGSIDRRNVGELVKKSD